MTIHELDISLKLLRVDLLSAWTSFTGEGGGVAMCSWLVTGAKYFNILGTMYYVFPEQSLHISVTAAKCSLNSRLFSHNRQK